jgi:hypothetical protein
VRYVLVLVCTAAAWLILGVSQTRAATELVTLVKVLQDDDKGIIERRNGERWLVEKGVGARTFWRYEGRQVLITSPGRFCGPGSRLIIPDTDQEARIVSAEMLTEGTATSVGRPVAAGGADAGRAVVLALTTLSYLDSSSTDEAKKDPIAALTRFQTDNKIGETNGAGPKTLTKLAELVLKERGDNPEALDLAQALIAAARQMKGATPVRPAFGRSADELTETHIISVTASGAVIRLADGSAYEVDGIDQIKSAMWLPTQNVIKKPGALINLENGESVNASLLK